MFGPLQLQALEQVAGGLAAAIGDGQDGGAGPDPTPWSAPEQRRFRVRNRSGGEVRLRFHRAGDRLRWIPLPGGRRRVGAHGEAAYFQRQFSLLHLKARDSVSVTTDGGEPLALAAGALLTIAADGSASVGPYEPPPRSAA
jgi:hypothetical protein